METINLKPKSPQLDGRDIDALCDAYLDAIKGRVNGVSHYGFAAKLAYFRQFWKENGAQHDHILTPKILESFNDWLEQVTPKRTGKPLSWNSRADALRRFRQMMRWAWRNGYVSSDWGQYVPAARGKPTPHDALPLVDLRLMFDQCFMSQDHLRDCALLAIFAGTGVRRTEAAYIRVKDVRFVEPFSGLIDIHKAKGSNFRTVAFDSVAGRYIRMYIDRHPDPDGYLFPGRFGGEKPAKNETLGRILRFHAQTAGVDFDGCHQIRRTFATHWILKLPGEGYGAMLARQLGHTISGMTLGTYVKLTAEDIRRVMERNKCSAFAQMLK